MNAGRSSEAHRQGGCVISASPDAAGRDNVPLGLRSLLLRVPPFRQWVERRWITDPVERSVHDEVVRGRLEAPVPSETLGDPPDAEETQPPS